MENKIFFDCKITKENTDFTAKRTEKYKKTKSNLQLSIFKPVKSNNIIN